MEILTDEDKSNPNLPTRIWMLRVDVNKMMPKHGSKNGKATSQNKAHDRGNHCVDQIDHKEQLKKIGGQNC